VKYVALSGGADSVYLLLKLLKEDREVTALHCNFHLRGEESNRDEAFCRKLCERLGVTLKVRHFNTAEYAQEHHLSIETAARELRYRWFASETDTIYVAHHRDDLAETVLMNLLRGTGLKGLTGISEDTVMSIPSRENGKELRTLRIVRPLLKKNKEDILHYLEDEHQDFVTDSTNLERDALRNRIRLDLLPLMERLNPQAREHLCRLAENVKSELETSEASALFHLLSPLGFNRTQIIDIAHYKGRETRKWQSKSHRLIKSNGTVVFEPIRPTRTEPFRVDADRVGGPLLYRRVRPGDRFRPFGMKNGSKLVNDFLAEHGVNLLERAKSIVAHTADGRIVWIVDHEIDDRFRVDESTRNVMTLTFS
jgi:tRNA(Ile)-lysidine synthase